MGVTASSPGPVDLRRPSVQGLSFWTQPGHMIVRLEREDGKYFTARKEWAQDTELSWQARGVLAYLFTHTDGWEVRVGDIVKNGPCQKYKIRSVMKELEEAGYLQREKERQEDGTFDWVSVIHEVPTRTESGVDPSPNDSSMEEIHDGSDRGLRKNEAERRNEGKPKNEASSNGEAVSERFKTSTPFGKPHSVDGGGATKNGESPDTSREEYEPGAQEMNRAVGAVLGADSVGDAGFEAARVFADLFGASGPREHISRLLRERNRLVGQTIDGEAVNSKREATEMLVRTLFLMREMDNLQPRSDGDAERDRPDAALNYLSKLISNQSDESDDATEVQQREAERLDELF